MKKRRAHKEARESSAAWDARAWSEERVGATPEAEETIFEGSIASKLNKVLKKKRIVLLAGASVYKRLSCVCILMRELKSARKRP